MRYALSVIALLLYVLVSNGTAFGQITAPDAVLVLSEKDSERLIEDLRDLQTLRTVSETQSAEIETLKRQLAEKDNAIASLKDAFTKEQMAMTLSDDREKRRQDIENEYKGVLSESRALNVEMREALKEVMMQNRSLQRELFWTRILGPIAGLGAVVGVFFLH